MPKRRCYRAVLWTENLMDILEPANCSPSLSEATRKILSRSRLRPNAKLSGVERSALRKAKIKKASLCNITGSDLATRTGLPVERSHEMVGLCTFQTLKSIGPASAEDLWQLGYNAPGNLAGEHPYAMYLAYSSLVGELIDRCVEDVFRCAVAQAELPNLPDKSLNWWAWTSHRGEQRLPSRGTPGSDLYG